MARCSSCDCAPRLFGFISNTLYCFDCYQIAEKERKEKQDRKKFDILCVKVEQIPIESLVKKRGRPKKSTTSDLEETKSNE